MFKKCVMVLCWSVLAAPAWSQTEASATHQAVQDKVLVVGQRPGPGLWKISKGGHVLWVFGTYSPLPAKMAWRSQQVETILAQSQEYLAPPGASATVGFFRGLILLPHMIGITKNPDGKLLRDVVPADVYARWLVLKAKYLGVDDDVERERPLFAADKLYRAGLKHAGLSSSDEVLTSIEQLVKKNKIKTLHSHVKMEVADPARTLKEFKKGSMDDAACFATTIERLETDIDAMRVRANAWAKGDVEAIRSVGYADRDAVCFSAMSGSSALKSQPDWHGIEQRVRKLWLEAAEKALATNTTSFAVLDLKHILDAGDALATLKAKGYLIEAPE